jgi:nanoRNase/pAp phosphatase (c-di-AMP/oligoRNAs hydrolase)
MDHTDVSTPEKLVDMEKVIGGCKRLLVLTHDNPDPDGLASAEGLRYLFQKRWGVRVRAAYGGIVGRAENQTMLKVLNLRVDPVEKIKLSSFSNIALVDTQPKAGNNSLPPWVNADLVIDHHPRRRGIIAPFVDVREQYGATSTIITEYLLQAGLEIPTPLATALFYGIASDTRHLGRQVTGADVKAYMSLFPLANMRRLSNIEFPPLPNSYFVNIDRALENAFTHRNIIGSRVGAVDNPDIIPEFADLLLRHERATWSICLGCWKGHLIVSVRTSNPRADAGRIVRRLIGKKGRAGGHGMMAAGRMSCPENDEQGLSALEEKIIRRFLKALGKKESAALEPLLPSSLRDAASPSRARAE